MHNRVPARRVPGAAPRRLSALLTLAAVLASPALASADVAFWNGAPGEWTTPSNWIPALVPNAPGDAALFQTGSGTVIVTLDAPVTVRAIIVDASAAYRFDPMGTASSLTFASTLSTASLLVTAAAGVNTTTFNLPVTLASDFSVANDAAVIFAGSLAGSGNLTLTGLGEVRLTGTNSAWTPVSIVINAGLLSSNNGNLHAFGNLNVGAITVNPGGSLDVTGIVANPTGQQFTKALHLAGAGSGTIGTGALIFGGTPNTLAGPITIKGPTTFAGKAAGAILQLGSPLANSSTASFTGAGTLIKAGPGTLQLNLHAAHSGGTTVTAGTLTITQLGSLVGTGTTHVNSGGNLVISKPAGADHAVHSLSPNTLDLHGGTLTVSADIPLASLFAPTTTSGFVTLNTGAPYTAGGTNLLDLSSVPPGALVRLGASTSTPLAPTLTLVPDAFSHTLFLGGGSGTLTLDAHIADVGSTPTNVDIGTGTQVVRMGSTANTYTGFTSLNNGANVIVTHAAALGSVAGTTLVNAGAVLSIQVPLAEPFTLNGGTLSADAALSGNLRNISGVANLAATGSAPLLLSGGHPEPDRAVERPRLPLRWRCQPQRAIK